MITKIKKGWSEGLQHYFSLLEIASGSLNVEVLSTPLLEYSRHLLAAAAALFALSLISSSAKTMYKFRDGAVRLMGCYNI